jgi:hypothetical protein
MKTITSIFTYHFNSIGNDIDIFEGETLVAYIHNKDINKITIMSDSKHPDYYIKLMVFIKDVLSNIE